MRQVDEVKAVEDLVDINKQSVERAAKKRAPKPAQRGQHPKHHACVGAIFRVLENIPADLKNGLFANPREYKDTWVRFSNGGQDDDRKPDAHGMAIKVLGVDGSKLIEGREHEEAQDFILIDNETFFTGDPALYVVANQALLGGHGKLTGFALLLTRSIARDPLLAYRIIKFASKRPTSPLKEHEPLGFINRARGRVYRDLARERHTLNGIDPKESSERPESYGKPPRQA